MFRVRLFRLSGIGASGGSYRPPLACFGEKRSYRLPCWPPTCWPAALFFTLALLAFTFLPFAVLLLAALLAGCVSFAGFVWILLCVHDAFLYY